MQKFTFYKRFFLNLLGALALGCTLTAALLAVHTSNHHHGGVDTILLIPLIMIGAALLWAVGLRFVVKVGRWFWTHVSLLAVFDREQYAPGDAFTVQVTDRVSEGSDRRYRVHLSFVEEYLKTDTRNHKQKQPDEYRRRIMHTEYQDVTAGELHQGIQWAIPPDDQQLYFTELRGRNYPCYWELLIEEFNSDFHARFFVNVVNDQPDYNYNYVPR